MFARFDFIVYNVPIIHISNITVLPNVIHTYYIYIASPGCDRYLSLQVHNPQLHIFYKSPDMQPKQTLLLCTTYRETKTTKKQKCIQQK